MAEIPALPGCRVWGDTPDDTIEILQDVAAAIIETRIERGYDERGYDLPDEVKDSLIVTDNSNELVESNLSHKWPGPRNLPFDRPLRQAQDRLRANGVE